MRISLKVHSPETAVFQNCSSTQRRRHRGEVFNSAIQLKLQLRELTHQLVHPPVPERRNRPCQAHSRRERAVTHWLGCLWLRCLLIGH